MSDFFEILFSRSIWDGYVYTGTPIFGIRFQAIKISPFRGKKIENPKYFRIGLNKSPYLQSIHNQFFPPIFI